MGLWQSVKSFGQKIFQNFGVSSFFTNNFTLTDFTKRQLLEQNKGVVWACISAIASRVALIDFEASIREEDGSETRTNKNTLVQLLENPNAQMSKYQLIEYTQSYLEATGVAYWWLQLGELTRKPKAIYILRPDLMKEFLNEDGDIIGWVLTKPGGAKIPFEADEIIQFKLPDLLNPYGGYGPVEAGQVYIQTEDHASQWTRNFIANAGMPAGIVSIKSNISKEEFEKVKLQWKKEYGGKENAGKNAFVKGAQVDFTKIGASLGEVALRDLQSMTRDAIMTMFRVNKTILGITEDVNLANAKVASYVFMSEIINPKMYRIVDTINAQLTPRFRNAKEKKYWEISYVNPIPEDQEAKLAYYRAALDPNSGWLGINEVRSEEGKDDVENGAGVYRPINAVEVGQPIPAKKELPPVGLKKKKEGEPEIKLTTQQKELFRFNLYRRASSWERKFKEVFNKFLNQQKKKIISKLGKKKAYDEYLFNLKDEYLQLVEVISPVILELMREQGQEAVNLVGADLEFAVNERVQKYVRDRAEHFIPPYLKDLSDNLANSLTEGFKNGEALTDLTKRVESIYSDAEGYEAERIARTETQYAANKAAIEGYYQSGYVHSKEWYANPGACEFCGTMDGTILGLDTDFAKVGEVVESDAGGTLDITFMDVNGPPLHPNCECTVLPSNKEV